MINSRTPSTRRPRLLALLVLPAVTAVCSLPGLTATAAPGAIGASARTPAAAVKLGADRFTTVDRGRHPYAAPLVITDRQLLANDRATKGGLRVTTMITGKSAHGTVRRAKGSTTYMPTRNFTGTARFSYRACAGSGRNAVCATQSVTISVLADRAPVFTAFRVAGREDQAVAVVLRATDPDRDRVSFRVTSGPGHGRAGAVSTTAGSRSGTQTARLTYTPARNWNGRDRFTVRVSDGRMTRSAVVSVDVAAVNDAPTARPDSFDVHAGDLLTLDATDLTGNDGVGPGDEDDQSLTVTRLVPGAETHGTLSLADDTISYRPAAGFEGTARFGYVVCDDGTTAGRADARCATGTVTVAVTDRTPVAEGVRVSTDLLGTAQIHLAGSDPDGDALTWNVTAPSQGTLSGQAPDLTYQAALGQTGTVTFTYTVSDGVRTSAPATVTIEPGAGLPTTLPTTLPTGLPTDPSGGLPTSQPTDPSGGLPTGLPSVLPTSLPSILPTSLPTVLPTGLPTVGGTGGGDLGGTVGGIVGGLSGR
ncbi:hypothetical protein FHX74_003969 [Friedmanniella endophytica]|uniref:Tandem-95 repeat protein n=1 Tax=Microlunatus kandeliicorticis TaxID=1759536 RepID=A0A7W3IW13_9ACTN|nr:Ig-like domain-containing protein [Microlunatus kandeliicorticis]MBA8796316.1 hypothetical protein [Microlunatus kandeliicorticis]